MRLNKDQREGVAKVLDNLATACLVAAVVGGLVDHKVGAGTVLLLFSVALVLIWSGLNLRAKEGDSDGN